MGSGVGSSEGFSGVGLDGSGVGIGFSGPTLGADGSGVGCPMEGFPFAPSPMEGLPFAPSPIGDSAAKAIPAEAAMMPNAAVAANTEAVVFFMISPETDVMRDECMTLTDARGIMSRP